MHVGITRPRQFAMHRERRAAGEQEHRQAIAEQVLDRHARIRRARIDMHEHGLRAAGCQRVPRCHVHGDNFMRTQDDFRMFAALAIPRRERLDQRHMIGAEIGEDIFDAEIDQRFKEMMCGRMAAHAHAAFSATNLLRSVPMPVISISTSSPALMFGEAPSVPIQITSPGHSVKYFVISTMNSLTPNSMSLVRKRLVSLPFTRTMVSILSRSAEVSIHGPIGLKVSAFFERHRPRSAFCQVRSLTSLPMV